MGRFDIDGAVVAPQTEQYKEYEKGVKTPVAQVVYFALGASVFHFAVRVFVVDEAVLLVMRWSAFVLLSVLGLGLMLRMAGPSIKSAIERYAQGKAWAEREQMEGRIAYLEALLEQAGVKNLQSEPIPALQAALTMIQVQAQRVRTGHGLTWSRDNMVGKMRIGKRAWGTACEILEGAGIRDPKTGDFLADNELDAKGRLMDFVNGGTGTYKRTTGGNFVKTK